MNAVGIRTPRAVKRIAAQQALAPDAASLRCAAQVKREPLGIPYAK